MHLDPVLKPTHSIQYDDPNTSYYVSLKFAVRIYICTYVHCRFQGYAISTSWVIWGTVLFTLAIVLISASMLKKEYRSDLAHSVGKV